jgi:hypothetical protein
MTKIQLIPLYRLEENPITVIKQGDNQMQILPNINTTTPKNIRKIKTRITTIFLDKQSMPRLIFPSEYDYFHFTKEKRPFYNSYSFSQNQDLREEYYKLATTNDNQSIVKLLRQSDVIIDGGRTIEASLTVPILKITINNSEWYDLIRNEIKEIIGYNPKEKYDARIKGRTVVYSFAGTPQPSLIERITNRVIFRIPKLDYTPSLA